MDENYDSFYYYEPPKFAGETSTSRFIASTGSYTQPLYTTYTGVDARLIESMFTKLVEEKKPVSDAQREIKEAVREAIEGPKREAEIARRVAAVEKIGVEDKYEDGTVLRWKRLLGKTNYIYVAIKAEGKWFVTGSQMASAQGWTWTNLIEWMTTGENLITDLEVAGPEWTTIL